ncbi:MAG: hypothetical protein ABJB03_00485 [Rhodoglobus sp.]
MKTFTTILDLAGLVAIVAGVAIIWGPFAYLVGGLGLIGLSFAITRTSAAKK